HGALQAVERVKDPSGLSEAARGGMEAFCRVLENRFRGLTFVIVERPAEEEEVRTSGTAPTSEETHARLWLACRRAAEGAEFCDAVVDDSGDLRNCVRKATVGYGALALCSQHERVVTRPALPSERTNPSGDQEFVMQPDGLATIEKWWSAKQSRA